MQLILWCIWNFVECHCLPVLLVVRSVCTRNYFSFLGDNRDPIIVKNERSKPLARSPGFQILMLLLSSFYLSCCFICHFTKTTGLLMEQHNLAQNSSFVFKQFLGGGEGDGRERIQNFCWIRNYFCWTLVASNLFYYSKEKSHRTAWQNEFTQVQRFSGKKRQKVKETEKFKLSFASP